MTQIIYDNRDPISRLRDEQAAWVNRLESDLSKAETKTKMWLAGTVLCFGFTIYSGTQIPNSFNRNLLNTIVSGLGVAASSVAVKNARKFQKLDRVVYKEMQREQWYEEANKAAERGAYEIDLDNKLAYLKLQHPDAQQSQQKSSAPAQVQPEWKEEGYRIEAVFRGLGLPVLVVDKVVAGPLLHYALRPTKGVEVEQLVSKGTAHKLQLRMLVEAGFEDAKVAPKAGVILLTVKNPDAPKTLDIQPMGYVVEPASHGPVVQQAHDWHPQPQGMGASPTPTRNYARQDTAESNPLFEKFLKAPHNYVCGKTGGGKTFLLSMLVIEWLKNNPDGEIYILDRNFGKPDRVTGEIFDWNGIDERCIFVKDADILEHLNGLSNDLNQLFNEFAEYAKLKSKAAREGTVFNMPAPQKRKVLIVLTEQNAITEDLATSRDLTQSPIVSAIKPILQQGNGYGFKLICDGQSISVGLSGITEGLRQNFSVCMIGENTVTTKEVKAFGSNTQELVQKCSMLRQQGKRACIIQLGEGSPEASVVPDLSHIREFRFGSQPGIPKDDPYESWDEDYQEGVGKGRQPEEDISAQQPPKTASTVPPDSPLALLIANLKQWIAALPSPPDDTALAAKLLEVTGQRFSAESLKGLKQELGL